MIDILQFEFMRNALYAAILVSIACGIVGTFIVIKRIVFISGGITHAAFGGIGLGYLLGVNPVLTAIPFSLLAACAVGMLRTHTKISEDSAIGMLWAVGMALGILFIGLTPGYVPDLFSYLFGSILTVPLSDIVIMIVLDTIIVVVVFVFYKEFHALAFDEEFSLVVGIPTQTLYVLLLCLVALSVIILIRVVGIILVLALLTIPAVIARQVTMRLNRMMVCSTVFAVVSAVVGLWLSYILNLPSGATIVLVLSAAFLGSVCIRRLRTAAVRPHERC